MWRRGKSAREKIPTTTLAPKFTNFRKKAVPFDRLRASDGRSTTKLYGINANPKLNAKQNFGSYEQIKINLHARNIPCIGKLEGFLQVKAHCSGIPITRTLLHTLNQHPKP